METVKQALGASNDAELLATYENWAKSYNSDLDKEEYVAPDIGSDYLTDCYKTSGLADIKILDIGCGTGLVGQRLAEKGAKRIDGIDFSPAMLDVAGQTNAYTLLKVADVSQRLETSSGAYDAVISVGLLTKGHVGPEAIDEMVRVVRPGGFLVLSVRGSIWESSGYKAKLQALIKDEKIKLAIDDFKTRRISKDVDLIYAVVQVS